MMNYREFRELHDYASTVNGVSIDKAYDIYFKDNAKVGDGATVHYWSDAHAYTIVKRTAKTLTLRRCKATLADGWKPEYIPGGFSVICTNDESQRWQYEEDEDGDIVKAHWSDTYGFRVNGCLNVSFGRHEHYDYNF